MDKAQSISATETSALSSNYRRDYGYYRKVFSAQTMPFAFIDLDLLDQNIRQIAERAGGKRIRLASKSIRCIEMLKRIFATDPCFQGIMCYHPAEAVYLARHGFDDLLLGYPIWHKKEIAAIAQAIAQGSKITLMIDSSAHITQIEAVAARQEVRIPVCLDIDMSLDVPGLRFGVWRSPLRTPTQVRPIIDSLLASSHVYLEGIMGYEAQVAGVGDHAPHSTLKNMLVRWLKQRSVAEVATRRSAIIDLVKSYALPLRFINGGGTGSIATTRTEPGITEITVGSGFYSPALFDYYRDFRYQPAAGFAVEIVRQPGPDLYTCLGGGYIASGAVGPEKLPLPYLPEGAQLVDLEGAGEVQTPIKYDGRVQLHPGDPVFLRHSKAGELCERFTHLLLVSQGKIVGEATTYRGDGQCFL